MIKKGAIIASNTKLGKEFASHGLIFNGGGIPISVRKIRSSEKFKHIHLELLELYHQLYGNALHIAFDGNFIDSWFTDGRATPKDLEFSGLKEEYNNESLVLEVFLDVTK